MNVNLPSPTTDAGLPEAALQGIVQALSGLRYGHVTVIVQDGKVVQIDRTDRVRLPVPEPIPESAKP